LQISIVRETQKFMAAITDEQAGLNSRPHVYSSKSLWLIAACFVLSGATGLIYEVLWARMLGLVFGATTLAVSAVLAAFMGGLALGSACGGRLAARFERPLRVYGVIEIGIALYALAVPFLFHLIDLLYPFIWQQLHPGFYAFSLWRFLLSFLVLLAPTTLMGATLPVLSATLLRSDGHGDTSVTRLYACNLFGAIIGTLFAGFLLLPTLGVRHTIWTAATINLLIGLTAIIADLKDRQSSMNLTATTESDRSPEASLTTLTEPDERALEDKDESDVSPHSSGPNYLPATERINGPVVFWLACAFVSGFVTFSAQVAWARVLTMVIGSSTYAFSIVVALFLLGLSGGAAIVARQKTDGPLRRNLLKVELATAFGLFISLWVQNRAPGILIRNATAYGINSWPGWLALQALVAAMLILLPAFLMGMVMPLVLVWASRAGAKMSVGLVGRSYAVNTLGAIAGAFGTGFLLIPKAGTRFTILFAAALCIVMAGFAYRPASEKADKDLRVSLAAGASIALIILLLICAPPLNSFDLAAGAYDNLVSALARPQLSVGNEQPKINGPDAHRLLMFKEGPTATVSVREDWGARSLAINGRTNASDTGDMPTQIILGQMPVLFAPRTDNALIVGFASGVSVGSLLQSPLKSLECVELEPATLEAASYFNHVNHRPLEDARLRLIIDDARTYLRVTSVQYDMIVSEPSHPWVPGVANLFTKEFFELGRSRLRDDGIFVQWVQIYQLSTESLRSVLATYESVFPHVQMFRVGGAAKGKDLILVGSRAPLTLEHLGERMSDTRVSRELARINIKGPEDILAWYVCDETELGPAVAGAVINTDDNMRIETSAPRESFKPFMDANAAWIEALTTGPR
jgi:spermidine synthase